MSEIVEWIVRSALIGVGATVGVDLWAILQTHLFGAPAPDWAQIGRWFGGFPQGRFVQVDIAKAPAVQGELAIGWAAHYAIGIGYAALLLTICGLAWARHPTLLPAFIFGAVTLVAPFFLMQPGLGMGIAASKTSNPGVARLRSILAHAIFGFGLYLSAWISAPLIP